MKDLFNKNKKIISWATILVFVFIGSFIFVKNKTSLNPETYPYYYGVGAKGLTLSEISNLTKAHQGSTPSFTITVSPINQVWYFAYLDSYSALTSVRDQNGFELTADFTVTTGNSMISSSDDKTTYRVYEYNNVTTLSNYKVTYIQ
jgi:hypothetical protein